MKTKSTHKKGKTRVPSALSDRKSDQRLLTSVFSKKQLFVLIGGISLWFVAVFFFWEWWINKAHVVDWIRFWINTILLSWSMILPAYFYFFVLQGKRPQKAIAIPNTWRVAMVVTKSPGEPFEVVQRTLLAMIEQEYPHDNWLADEDPTEETKLWCLLHGVQISTRKNILEYHQPNWPRRTKCKEGNLAYFYDKVGYANYDFVVQLDADHIPEHGYLEEMLKPFIDDSVGYVSAPSICDFNENDSWAPRGRLYAEGVMHGALQAGYSYKYAPLCIGSHYAVRTKALEEIGGLGPELAEDHSTTLMMNSHSWKGVHAIDAIAHGEGPGNLEDCLIQEFQWSRSLSIISVEWLPRFWKGLSAKDRVQFVFSELWYPIFTFTMLVGILLPIIALATNVPWVNVNYLEFLLHALPVTLVLIANTLMLKRFGLLRPYNAKIFSIDATVFQLMRWPWAFWGVITGLVNGLYGKAPEFKVTRKDGKNPIALDWKYLMPSFIIIAVSLFSMVAFNQNLKASGYMFFLILNVFLYMMAIIYAVSMNYKESRQSEKA